MVSGVPVSGTKILAITMAAGALMTEADRRCFAKSCRDSPESRQLFAKHLLSASVMSAPAAIVMAKILVPETGTPDTMGGAEIQDTEEVDNVIEAAASGASDGLRLALNVGAMLLAFLALIGAINAGFEWVGAPVVYGTELYNLNELVAQASGGRFDALSLEAVFGFLIAHARGAKRNPKTASSDSASKRWPEACATSSFTL